MHTIVSFTMNMLTYSESSGGVDRATDYTIENHMVHYTEEGLPYATYSFTAGDVIVYMRITFKIVKYGFSLGIEFPNVIGISIVIICAFASIAILYKMGEA